MQKINTRQSIPITPHSAALVLVVALILVSGLYFASQSGVYPESYSNDFNVYYYAAREMTEGRDPYQQSLGEWVAYLYPPLFAELLIPVALLPLPVAAYVWFLISVTAMLVTAWMCGALFDDEKSDGSASPFFSRRVLIAAGAGLILIRFVLDNFNMGQVNTFVTMFAVAHVYLFAKKRRLAAAFALGIAVALKLTPGLLIVYHLAKRRWTYAALCGAATAIVMAASFLPFGTRAPQVFSVFMNRTVKNQQGFNLAYSGNQSLRATLARVAGGPTESMEQDDATARKPTTGISLIAAAILLALAVIAAALARSPAAAAPFFACYVLISPLSWKAHFVALTLPVAYLIGQMLTLNDKRWQRAIAVVLGVAFLLFTFTSHRLVGVVAADWADSHSLICLTALLVFFATTIVMMRQRASRKQDLIIGDETA